MASTKTKTQQRGRRGPRKRLPWKRELWYVKPGHQVTDAHLHSARIDREAKAAKLAKAQAAYDEALAYETEIARVGKLQKTRGFQALIAKLQRAAEQRHRLKAHIAQKTNKIERLTSEQQAEARKMDHLRSRLDADGQLPQEKSVAGQLADMVSKAPPVQTQIPHEPSARERHRQRSTTPAGKE